MAENIAKRRESRMPIRREEARDPVLLKWSSFRNRSRSVPKAGKTT
ncbi:MAG: hypothetical protein A4E57_00041 [Syntrophorhabdaceae bacterium PtaU1.Bin034]|nr:MAG: hypothetical protein A4E57_00041 [Syntrophorhabdaceae bacterium PtaU1.Bin034]